MNKAPSIVVARGLGLLAWLVCGEAMAEDCNHNGQQDVADIAACISLDMNGNGIPDECDIAEGRIPDCNENGIADWVDIYAQEDPCGNMIGGASQDCNTDGIPDDCQLSSGDCDGDGVLDVCEIRDNTQADADGNTIPDSCEIASGAAPDCNGNNVPDAADVRPRLGFDANAYNLLVPPGQRAYPVDIAVGDVNGDNWPDLVTANEAENGESLGVFKNRQDGTFLSGSIAHTDGPAYSLALADLDGDGDLDAAIVMAVGGSTPIGILLNDGTGKFSLIGSVNATPSTIDIAAGDIDGDDDNDLVVADMVHGSMELLLNNGSGAFPSRVSLPIGSAALAFYLGDLDLDQDLDLFILTESREVRAYRNNGGLSFSLYYSAVHAEQDFATQLAAGDLNGDARPDIVLAIQPDHAVGVLLNAGTSFGSLEKFGPYAGMPVAVAIGDIDGDGLGDVAATMNPPTPNGPMSVMRGTGDGNLLGPTSYLAGDSPLSVLAADLDRDGRMDIASAIYLEKRVRVWLNRGQPAQSLDVNGNGIPDECECPADVDGSGFVDLEDFITFVQAFEIGDDDADFDGSGFVDTDDFDAFVRAFELGC